MEVCMRPNYSGGFRTIMLKDPSRHQKRQSPKDDVVLVLFDALRHHADEVVHQWNGFAGPLKSLRQSRSDEINNLSRSHESTTCLVCSY